MSPCVYQHIKRIAVEPPAPRARVRGGIGCQRCGPAAQRGLTTHPLHGQQAEECFHLGIHVGSEDYFTSQRREGKEGASFRQAQQDWRAPSKIGEHSAHGGRGGRGIHDCLLRVGRSKKRRAHPSVLPLHLAPPPCYQAGPSQTHVHLPGPVQCDAKVSNAH